MMRLRMKIKKLHEEKAGDRNRHEGARHLPNLFRFPLHGATIVGFFQTFNSQHGQFLN